MKEPARIFITGASTGLGRGLALSYAGPGVTLGLLARRKELLEELADELESKGAAVHLYAQDVADTKGMGRACADFLAQAGGVDLVIANAGVGIKDRLREGVADEVAWLMTVNVIGVTNTVVPFVPAMIAEGGGTLVAVGSFAGHRAIPGRTAYSASKAAVMTFMDGLRMDLEDTGVHAMTLCPGFVETPLTAHNPEMFFVLQLEEAVAQMRKAIAARKNTFTFPWQMNVLKELMKRSPEPLLRRFSPKPRTRSSS